MIIQVETETKEPKGNKREGLDETNKSTYINRHLLTLMAHLFVESFTYLRSYICLGKSNPILHSFEIA